MAEKTTWQDLGPADEPPTWTRQMDSVELREGAQQLVERAVDLPKTLLATAPMVEHTAWRPQGLPVGDRAELASQIFLRKRHDYRC